MTKRRTNPYHSSLTSINPLDISFEIEKFESNGNIVLRNDLCSMKKLPDEFRNCDILYSEPAWKSGYEKFIARAKKEQSQYQEYIMAINDVILHEKRPIWIILGSHILSKFKKLDQIIPINLHGYMTNLCGWNDLHDYGTFKTNYDFVAKLAEKFSCVGDFCAGYGNTGRIFQEHQKKFILSDINGNCIYQIAKSLMGYKMITDD